MALKPEPPQPPRYIEALLDDFVSGGAGRCNHLGHWDDASAGIGRATRPEAQQRMNALLVDLAGIDDSAHVLDVGCGFGGTVEFINTNFADVSVTGLDVDGRQLDLCSRIRPRAGNQLTWVQGDACALPFQPASYDRAVSIEAMWHFASRTAFFEEIARVLKPGGRIACVDILVAPEAAASLGCSPSELSELLESGFAPWPEMDATLESVLQAARASGLSCRSVIDATANTEPTYSDHGDADARPGASAYSSNPGVHCFVELHRRRLLNVFYLDLVRGEDT